VTNKHVIAIDLGAESGRVMQADFDGTKLHMHEVHRFPNIPVYVGNSLHWDVLHLWHEMTVGIKAAAPGASSIGIDTWGVDFAFLDRDGNLVANPLHYRDQSSDGMMEWVFERMPRRELFERTGLQFIAPNGIWRLAYLARHNSPVLDIAHTYLTIADLFNYWLSGSKTCEFTHASTHQLYNLHTHYWDKELLARLGVPSEIFPEVVPPGTRLGEYHEIPVIAPACHDTGSAVVAVPTTTENYAYLSSGTWSLLGLEVTKPVISDMAYEANVTNEGGVYGTFRLLKNIAGMWLVQQCRATWQEEGLTLDYAELAVRAEQSEPFRSLIDPDDESFYAPGDMPTRIRDYCASLNQPAPEDVGQFVRAIYESLALKYRYVLDMLMAVSGRKVERLHIIGGGSRNALLCQMTANATGRIVVAGPSEATAIGNAVVQFISLGTLGNLQQAREMLSRTEDTQTYEPQNERLWEEQYQRFKAIVTP
jgi:rhamnulokinase